MANSIVKFDEHGDGLARYNIYNYQRKANESGYDYKVGMIYKKGHQQTLFDLQI